MNRRRFLSCIVCLAIVAVAGSLRAAITEKYVSSAGSGTADGSSEANALSWAGMITAINAGGTAGNRYNVIKGGGAIARTTTIDTISGSGTSTSPVIIRGYTTTITDGSSLGRTSSNGALVTTNFAVLTYTTGRLNVTGSWISFEAIDCSGAPSNVVISLAADSEITRCKVVNSSTNAGAIAISPANRSVVYDCDAQLTGSSGGSCAVLPTTGSRVAVSQIKGGPAIGVSVSSTCTVIDNLIYASTGIGVAMTSAAGAPTIYGNTIVGGSGDGINIVTGTTGLQFIVNNMITDNAGYGINGVSAANAIFAAHNRTRDNTSGADNAATDWLAATKYGHVTTDTGGPETDYTNAAAFNYTLISASPAVNAGQFLYRAIGAFQRQSTAGGSGGVSRSRVVNKRSPFQLPSETQYQIAP